MDTRILLLTLYISQGWIQGYYYSPRRYHKDGYKDTTTHLVYITRMDTRILLFNLEYITRMDTMILLLTSYISQGWIQGYYYSPRISQGWIQGYYYSPRIYHKDGYKHTTTHLVYITRIGYKDTNTHLEKFTRMDTRLLLLTS